MAQGGKVKKIAAVVALTLLIWIWADLAKTEIYTIAGATLNIARSPTSKLWVTFGQGELSADIEQVVFKGASSKVADLSREMKEGDLSTEFDIHPEELGMTTAGQYSLDVADFIQRIEPVRHLGLTVESAKPAKVTVNVRELIKLPMTVICLDGNGNRLQTKSIEPRQVEMYVPAEWRVEKHWARVVLTESEITQARLSAVESTPFIELPGGQLQNASTSVKVTLLKEPDQLENYTINMPTPGVLLSLTLQDQYKVEILNLEELTNAISIRATSAAKLAYENKDYQVIVKIEDKDAKLQQGQKEVIYNFPQEYLKNNQIELAQQPVQAKFRLKPVAGD